MKRRWWITEADHSAFAEIAGVRQNPWDASRALAGYRVAWAVRNDRRLEARTRLSRWARGRVEGALEYAHYNMEGAQTRKVQEGMDGEREAHHEDAWKHTSCLN